MMIFLYGEKVKRAKCEINFHEVACIGDKVAKDGVKLDESKFGQSSTSHHRKTTKM